MTGDAQEVTMTGDISPQRPSLPGSLVTPPGCVVGAEPLARAGSRAGVLLLHGFTGSPWELRPVAERLSASGYAIAMPLLAGHGTNLATLQGTTWRDWLVSARAALDWLAAQVDRVHLVGMSMGGLLAMLLSQQRSRAPIVSLTLLAPALALPPTTRLVLQAAHLLPWSLVVGKADPGLPGGHRPPTAAAVPMRAAASFLELQELTLAGVRPTSLPVLVLHGTRDPTVPFAAARRTALAVLGPAIHFVPVPGSGHLLPHDRDAAWVVTEVGDHIDAVEVAGGVTVRRG